MRQDFTWYGTYDVAVRKEGYETLKTESPVIAPWWQWVPFDFVADVLPFRLKDSHALSYKLKPTPETAVDPDRLVQRGQAMRDQLESGEKPAENSPRPAPPPPPAPRNRRGRRPPQTRCRRPFPELGRTRALLNGSVLSSDSAWNQAAIVARDWPKSPAAEIADLLLVMTTVSHRSMLSSL